MWIYRDSETMAFTESFLFDTKEEALTFICEATKKNMELYPEKPEFWKMLDDDDCEWSDKQLFEISVTTAKQALKKYFGE